MQMSTALETESGEMIVKRVSVPMGLEELMEGLTKEVLLKKPRDIYVFASEYFAKLLNLRESGQYKASQLRRVQSVSKQFKVYSDKTIPTKKIKLLPKQNSEPPLKVNAVSKKLTTPRRLQEERKENEKNRQKTQRTQKDDKDKLTPRKQDDHDKPSRVKPRDRSTSTSRRGQMIEDPKIARPVRKPPTGSLTKKDSPRKDESRRTRAGKVAAVTAVAAAVGMTTAISAKSKESKTKKSPRQVMAPEDNAKEESPIIQSAEKENKVESVDETGSLKDTSSLKTKENVDNTSNESSIETNTLDQNPEPSIENKEASSQQNNDSNKDENLTENTQGEVQSNKEVDATSAEAQEETKDNETDIKEIEDNNIKLEENEERILEDKNLECLESNDLSSVPENETTNTLDNTEKAKDTNEKNAIENEEKSDKAERNEQSVKEEKCSEATESIVPQIDSTNITIDEEKKSSEINEIKLVLNDEESENTNADEQDTAGEKDKTKLSSAIKITDTSTEIKEETGQELSTLATSDNLNNLQENVEIVNEETHKLSSETDSVVPHVEHKDNTTNFNDEEVKEMNKINLLLNEDQPVDVQDKKIDKEVDKEETVQEPSEINRASKKSEDVGDIPNHEETKVEDIVKEINEIESLANEEKQDNIQESIADIDKAESNEKEKESSNVDDISQLEELSLENTKEKTDDTTKNNLEKHVLLGDNKETSDEDDLVGKLKEDIELKSKPKDILKVDENIDEPDTKNVVENTLDVSTESKEEVTVIKEIELKQISGSTDNDEDILVATVTETTQSSPAQREIVNKENNEALEVVIKLVNQESNIKEDIGNDSDTKSNPVILEGDENSEKINSDKFEKEEEKGKNEIAMDGTKQSRDDDNKEIVGSEKDESKTLEVTANVQLDEVTENKKIIDENGDKDINISTNTHLETNNTELNTNEQQEVKQEMENTVKDDTLKECSKKDDALEAKEVIVPEPDVKVKVGEELKDVENEGVLQDSNKKDDTMETQEVLVPKSDVKVEVNEEMKDVENEHSLQDLRKKDDALESQEVKNKGTLQEDSKEEETMDIQNETVKEVVTQSNPELSNPSNKSKKTLSKHIEEKKKHFLEEGQINVPLSNILSNSTKTLTNKRETSPPKRKKSSDTNNKDSKPKGKLLKTKSQDSLKENPSNINKNESKLRKVKSVDNYTSKPQSRIPTGDIRRRRAREAVEEKVLEKEIVTVNNTELKQMVDDTNDLETSKQNKTHHEEQTRAKRSISPDNLGMQDIEENLEDRLSKLTRCTSMIEPETNNNKIEANLTKQSSFDISKLKQEIEKAGQINKNILTDTAAALKIQALWRGHKARANLKVKVPRESTQEGDDTMKLAQSVVLIQKIWRGFKVRKNKESGAIFGHVVEQLPPVEEIIQSEVEKNTHSKSALKIQSLWRGYNVRKNIATVEKKLEAIEDQPKSDISAKDIMNAAVKIQAGVRGYLQRKRINTLASMDKIVESDDEEAEAKEVDEMLKSLDSVKVPTDTPQHLTHLVSVDEPIIIKEFANNLKTEGKDDNYNDCDKTLTILEEDVKTAVEAISNELNNPGTFNMDNLRPEIEEASSRQSPTITNELDSEKSINISTASNLIINKDEPVPVNSTIEKAKDDLKKCDPVVDVYENAPTRPVTSDVIPTTQPAIVNNQPDVITNENTPVITTEIDGIKENTKDDVPVKTNNPKFDLEQLRKDIEETNKILNEALNLTNEEPDTNDLHNNSTPSLQSFEEHEAKLIKEASVEELPEDPQSSTDGLKKVKKHFDLTQLHDGVMSEEDLESISPAPVIKKKFYFGNQSQSIDDLATFSTESTDSTKTVLEKSSFDKDKLRAEITEASSIENDRFCGTEFVNDPNTNILIITTPPDSDKTVENIAMDEDQAALKIQSVFRGHRVRRSVKSLELPGEDINTSDELNEKSKLEPTIELESLETINEINDTGIVKNTLKPIESQDDDVVKEKIKNEENHAPIKESSTNIESEVKEVLPIGSTIDEDTDSVCVEAEEKAACNDNAQEEITTEIAEVQNKPEENLSNTEKLQEIAGHSIQHCEDVIPDDPKDSHCNEDTHEIQETNDGEQEFLDSLEPVPESLKMTNNQGSVKQNEESDKQAVIKSEEGQGTVQKAEDLESTSKLPEPELVKSVINDLDAMQPLPQSDLPPMDEVKSNENNQPNTGQPTISLMHTGEFHDSVVIPFSMTSSSGNTNEQINANTAQAVPPSGNLVNTQGIHDSALALALQLNQERPAGTPVVTHPHGDDVATGSFQAALASDKDDLPWEKRHGSPQSNETGLSMETAPNRTATTTTTTSNNNSSSQQPATNGRNMEVEAATKIQAGFRGYQVRKQLKQKNSSSETPSARRSGRRKSNGKLSNEPKIKANLGDEAKLEEQSAVKIQAGVRGFLVRRRQLKKQKIES